MQRSRPNALIQIQQINLSFVRDAARDLQECQFPPVHNIFATQVSDILPVSFFEDISRAMALEIVIAGPVDVRELGDVYRRRANNVRCLSSNATMRNPADDVCSEVRPVNGPRGTTLLQLRKLKVCCNVQQ